VEVEVGPRLPAGDRQFATDDGKGGHRDCFGWPGFLNVRGRSEAGLTMVVARDRRRELPWRI
jgi:hypothetical protein